MTEDALVQKAVATLRQARKVIELMHADREEGFQEEPSLADLVMVAQILTQTSVSDRMENSARSLMSGTPSFVPPAPPGSPEDLHAGAGGAEAPIAAAPPDVVATWMGDHWGVSLGENFMWKTCLTLEELSKALLDSANFAAEYRLKERPPA